ncbi:MAG TPA: glycosyl transferase family 2, partial [Candidatus Sulfopaludibacter sp.]|nr:glycosyl transferase family 2 [Candidatus Sulfopaludibacter sp.]
RAGGRVWLGLSAETRSIRDYRSFAEAGRMISRTAFTQLRHSALLLAGTLLAMALVFFVPPMLALAAPPAARGLGALAWLLMSAAYLPALRYYRRSPLWAPFLPLVAGFYAGCTVRSALQHWRGAGGLWKGRVHG